MTDSLTFEEVVSEDEWAIPCECHWHTDHRGEAEWIVVNKPWCCRAGGPRLWCNDCLQEVMEWEGGGITCCHCRTSHSGLRPRDLIVSVEPLYRDAA